MGTLPRIYIFSIFRILYLWHPCFVACLLWQIVLISCLPHGTSLYCCFFMKIFAFYLSFFIVFHIICWFFVKFYSFSFSLSLSLSLGRCLSLTPLSFEFSRNSLFSLQKVQWSLEGNEMFNVFFSELMILLPSNVGKHFNEF